MSQREDFEEAALKLGYNLAMRDFDSEDGECCYIGAQGAWAMWQECCALKAKAEPVAWSLTFTNENGVPCRDVFWSLESVNEHRLHNTEKRKLLCTVTPLYTQPQSAVPAGWKLVPIEPTNWMRTQGEEGIDDCSVKETWRRMLDAAPQPQSAE